METKKKKGGNDYLKEKIAKLQIELDSKQTVIDKQRSTISGLRADLDIEEKLRENDIKRLAAMSDDLMHYMGWLRRWIWVTFRAEKFVD